MQYAGVDDDDDYCGGINWFAYNDGTWNSIFSFNVRVDAAVVSGTGVSSRGYFNQVSASGAHRTVFDMRNTGIHFNPDGVDYDFTVATDSVAQAIFADSSQDKVTFNVPVTFASVDGISVLGTTTLSPANANVVLSPSGTGLVTINPATTGSIANVTGSFTTLAASDNTAFSGMTRHVPQAVTISGGAVTATRSYIIIDTEGGAATDDLDTITVSGVLDGMDMFVRQTSSARDVTYKHNTGNLWNPGTAPVDATPGIVGVILYYKWSAGNNRWILQSRTLA